MRLVCSWNLTLVSTLVLCAGEAQAAVALEAAFATEQASVAGTLLMPSRTNAAPCVVILGGTLSQTRDGALTDPGAPDRDALKRLADALAQAGYASLRFDWIGFGQSKPRPGWTGSYHDEATVAAAAIRWARTRPNISSVIVAGESAGAYLACLAAEAGTPADAYVLLGGFCGASPELYDYNFGRLARYADESPEHREWATANARRDLALGRRCSAMFAAAAEGKDQFEIVDGDFRMTLSLARRREELTWPPEAMFRYLKTPVLALAGSEDQNVPPEHALRIVQRVCAAGNTNVTSLLINACDHNFQWAAPEHEVAFRERYTLASFKRGYNPNVYSALINWLRKVAPSSADPDRLLPGTPTTPSYQRAILKPERDPKTGNTPERLQLAPGLEILEDITDQDRLAAVETLEGRIGPLLLGEGSQTHFVNLPAGMYLEEHPHGSESIVYTVRGQWVLCSAGRRQLMKPGSLFRCGAHISTGYEVPFAEQACILIFKGERSTAVEKEFIDYLKGLAARLEREQQNGEGLFQLKNLPPGHPARQFAREVNPQFSEAGSPAPSASASRVVGFDRDAPGQPPSGWLLALTGQGTPSWNVVSNATAPSFPNVLKQSAEVPRSSFPLCWLEGSKLQDGFVAVKFKTESGKVDQAAGVVWRARDPANYYVCRANALEDNVVLYKVQNGQRKALDIVGRAGGYGVETKVGPGEWHTLRVNFVGSRFKVLFNYQSLFEVEDSTFVEAGMVGLWTKADSVTLFDDFRFGTE